MAVQEAEEVHDRGNGFDFTPFLTGKGVVAATSDHGRLLLAKSELLPDAGQFGGLFLVHTGNEFVKD